jgi:hypothetical protein
LGFRHGCRPGSAGLRIEETSPPDIKEWWAGDNIAVTQSGFISLVNRGEVEAWPRYLVYGPGTVTFSDGDSPSSNTVSFGPLYEDQIALVTTLPRLRGVTDLSPGKPVQTLKKYQQFIVALENLAFNNDIPPLIEKFESKFGILPPQGEIVFAAERQVYDAS